MINKYLAIVYVVVALPVPSFAQEPAKEPPADAAKTLPPEPDKTLKRMIWEGYYNALLNRNYHLERSAIMTDASDLHASRGRIIAVISLVIPLIIVILQLQYAVKQRTEAKKLSASLGSMVCTVIVIGLGGYGLWYGLESSLDGSAEQVRAQEHKELYQDWKSLAAQWQDLHDLSLKKQPKEILRPQYDRLHILEEAIASRETSDLYDAELHRAVQAKLNKYLIEDAKQAKS